MTTEEWNRAFEHTMPLLGAGAGVLSVVFGVMALMRPPSLGRRVYSQDGQYLVAVRYPGQWNYLQDFVQPDDPDVVAVYSQIGPDSWGCLDFVCRHIAYRRDIGEWWSFPAETLNRGYGDCEDSSILLASLLRNFTNAYVAIGSFQGWGHAWVVNEEGEILESTYTEAGRVPDPEHYSPYVFFSNQEVIELWPGALGEAFELGRDESLKLKLLARALWAVA